MSHKNIINKKDCLLVLIGLIILLCIGTLYDYQIAQALFSPNHLFGIILAGYGYLPAIVCMAIGGILLIITAKTHKQVGKILCYIFGVIFQIAALTVMTIEPMLYIENMNIILSLVIGILLVGSCDYLIIKYTKDTDTKVLNKFIIVMLGVMLTEVIVINVIKVPWARPRMRLIVEHVDVQFQPWYIIGSGLKEQLISTGIASDEFKSFPSGHTGNAACAILLCLLPLICTKLKGKERLLFWSGVILTLLVAYSRMILGAHFLTDVTIGMGVTFVIAYIIVHCVYKKE